MDIYANAALISVLTASFLGSPHCVGMCGGFVALYSHQTKKQFQAHTLYNLGRLTTYVLLGVTAATAGKNIDSKSGIADFSALAIGALLILSGIMQFFGKPSIILKSLSENFANVLHKLIKPVLSTATRIKPFLIGLITTFLPCGWLYTFVGLALASADWKEGASIMLVFWLGTLPALTLTGVLSRSLTSGVGKYLPRISALLVILAGVFSIYSHFSHAHHHAHHHEHPNHESHGAGH